MCMFKQTGWLVSVEFRRHDNHVIIAQKSWWPGSSGKSRRRIISSGTREEKCPARIRSERELEREREKLVHVAACNNNFNINYLSIGNVLSSVRLLPSDFVTYAGALASEHEVFPLIEPVQPILANKIVSI